MEKEKLYTDLLMLSFCVFSGLQRWSSALRWQSPRHCDACHNDIRHRVHSADVIFKDSSIASQRICQQG